MFLWGAVIHLHWIDCLMQFDCRKSLHRFVVVLLLICIWVLCDFFRSTFWLWEYFLTLIHLKKLFLYWLAAIQMIFLLLKFYLSLFGSYIWRWIIINLLKLSILIMNECLIFKLEVLLDLIIIQDMIFIS